MRGLLKLRDYLVGKGPAGDPLNLPNCGGHIHLLCHSMGNYVLQVALKQLVDEVTGHRLPRLFDQVFMCAADVDDDVLEPRRAMGRLPEMTHRVTIYHNDGDVALWVSDATKGNPDRLGRSGPRRANKLDDKVVDVDCTPVVRGFVEHSYYRCGWVNDDIRECIDEVQLDGFSYREQAGRGWPQVCQLRRRNERQ